jgi:ABC-type phosphate transport system substrate-binding protein
MLKLSILKQHASRRAAVLLSLMLILPIAAQAGDLAVVVHPANRLKDISSSDLARICKGQQAKWPDGDLVIIALRRPGSLEMKVVLEKIYRMQAYELATRLESLNETDGPHASVLLFDSDSELIKAVERNPGALGVVDVYSITQNVSVIRVDGKLPFQSGYLLHRR